MKDHYNSVDPVARLASWIDSNRLELIGLKTMRAIGLGAVVTGSCLVVEGIWSHDVLHIVEGIGAITSNSFCASYAGYRIEQLTQRAELK